MQLSVDDDAWARRLVQLHSSGLPRGSGDHDERDAYLLFLNADRSLPLGATIVRVRPEDIVAHQAMHLRSVLWLVEKMKTYNPVTELVMGVRFPSGDILCYVLRRR